MTELRTRVMTGVIGGVALLGLVIFGGWIGIFLLTLLLSLGMVNEFAKMVLSLPDAPEKRYLLLCFSWFANLAAMFTAADFELLLLCFFALFGYFLFTARRHQPSTEPAFATHFKECMFSMFGTVYLVFLPIYLTRVHQSSNGVHWTILFLLVVWAGDTGAYFAGKKYGKRKLYPLISPKKTVEGAVGGLATGLVVSVVYKLLVFRQMGWVAMIAVPVLVGPVAQVGDLCESFLKRAFHIKDSGAILPGHGGFLDRFDGVVFSLPVMYACVRLFS